LSVPAWFYAEALGQHTTGVANLKRTIDAENNRLAASSGAVPPFTPGATQWTVRLH
jgi:hypothetical protein